MSPDFYQNILVIKHGALGDVVMALGPFAAIRRQHPSAKITLLTTPAFTKFLEPSRYFDEIWADDRPSLWQLSSWLRLKSRLKKGEFSRVYDLQTSDRSAWYFRLFGPQQRPEWSGIARGCSHPHANLGRDKMHTIERHREQLGVAGIPSVPCADLSWVNADTTRFSLQSPFVLLVPGGSPHRLDKRWPINRYAEIAKSLTKQGIQPVILGSDLEISLIQQIAPDCPSARDLCGKTSLSDVAVLARDAVGAIGNDTGPIHLIAAAGCPTVVLFSSASDPALTAPQGSSVDILRRKKLEELSVEAVAAALRLR